VQHTLKREGKSKQSETLEFEFQTKRILKKGQVKQQKILYALEVSYYQAQNDLNAHPRRGEEPTFPTIIRVSLVKFLKG